MKPAIRRGILLLCLLALPSLACARDIQGRVVLSVYGQIAQMWLSDLNRLLRDQESGFITREPNAALGEVQTAPVLALGAEYGLTGRVLLGLRYELLFPATELRIGSYLYPDRVYGIYLDAEAYGVTAKYLWPRAGSLVFNAGAEIFYLRLRNAHEVYKVRHLLLPSMTTLESLDYEGGTLGGKISGGADLFLFDWLSAAGEIGYRYARVGKVTGIWSDGRREVLKNTDGSDFSLDYGGVFFQGGIKFWL